MTQTVGALFSRREAVIAGVLLTLGYRIAPAQQAAGGDLPRSGGGGAIRDNQSMRGKIALVTGSTDGLGREVAERLGAMGALVIIHGRNRERGEEVVREIQTDGRGKAVFHQADLASLDEVRRLANTILGEHDRLDLLINNAGIWRTAGNDTRQTSRDGHELVFAVNYLSHFLLTYELLPLIKRSTPARIINVSSGAQQPIDFDNVMLTKGYTSMRAYSQSKLAQVMFTFDLARELADDDITVNALHPATLMNTTMVKRAGASAMSSVDEGADAVMQLAVSPKLQGRTGLYFSGMREARANAQAYDEEARAELETLSLKLTGLG